MSIENHDIEIPILIVDRSSSTCANCNQGATYEEKSHITRLGYQPGDGKGCGIRWTKVSSNYPETEEVIKKMRPDLEYVDIFSAYNHLLPNHGGKK